MSGGWSQAGSSHETYLRPGLPVVRWHRGSGWEATPAQPARGSSPYSPVWLVELLRGVTAAAEIKLETVDGARCRHLRARCDPSHAARRSRHGMELVDLIGSSELDAPDLWIDKWSAPTEIWIDSSWMRAPHPRSFHAGVPDETIQETTGFRAEIVLRDLGTAPVLVPPTGAAMRVSARAVGETSR